MSRAANPRIVALLGLAGLMGGCVGGLLGGGKADQLYSFGVLQDDAPVVAEASPRRLLSITPVQMPGAAAGDRILTVQGNESAYVKDVRWISPATMLMQAAIENTLRARVADLMIAHPSTARKAQTILSIRLSRFDAQYPSDGNGLPTVRIMGDAALIDAATRRIIARLPIDTREAAHADGSAALASAFDRATQLTAVLVSDGVNQRLPVPTVTQ